MSLKWILALDVLEGHGPPSIADGLGEVGGVRAGQVGIGPGGLDRLRAAAISGDLHPPLKNGSKKAAPTRSFRIARQRPSRLCPLWDGTNIAHFHRHVIRAGLANFPAFFLPLALPCCCSFHAKNVIDVVFSGVRQMIDKHSFVLNLVDADILIDKKSPKAILSHKGVFSENSHFREGFQLPNSIQDLL